MLGLAYVLATEGLADREFLDTHCTGYERFERYLLGHDDGVAKSPEWAAHISGLSADTLRALAHRMAAERTIVTVSWSLQRTRTASRRRGWVSRWPRCWARSGFPAADSATATAR